jgi:hypothetical protein
LLGTICIIFGSFCVYGMGKWRRGTRSSLFGVSLSLFTTSVLLRAVTDFLIVFNGSGPLFLVLQVEFLPPVFLNLAVLFLFGYFSTETTNSLLVGSKVNEATRLINSSENLKEGGGLRRVVWGCSAGSVVSVMGLVVIAANPGNVGNANEAIFTQCEWFIVGQSTAVLGAFLGFLASHYRHGFDMATTSPGHIKRLIAFAILSTLARIAFYVVDLLVSFDDHVTVLVPAWVAYAVLGEFLLIGDVLLYTRVAHKRAKEDDLRRMADGGGSGGPGFGGGLGSSAASAAGGSRAALLVSPEKGALLTACRHCYVKEIEIMLLPCKHVALCADCGPSVASCPLCKTAITDQIKVYLH